ncbi:uncharacterized protein NECHADRAFT_81997 [Fusarium vanettenii 77-13-4]|uniref:Fungal N-terminal domain-containing protein n=1 Tax=Fusarium vanettenii (strain ATCC MYA-4622 / CBS 123669 / FGSC 9596 / NRRL 45880 / 77-13-4) TaxID=660122 RepID=C7ZA71_FUSV7|nr:uncharacterized protein NECHADRAFT_81997 [Fusarium vanettenii 77-13-4]EEU39627.1 predicted protein [Fusarium vanettenii 77-13-4]
MAEVLGIVAGAAQLLDLSTRVLVASSSLYGKLKSIPGEIETLKKNTELFIDLLWMISSDFDGPINSQVHSLHVTHRITSILHDARKESEELALLLEGLSSNNSSTVRRNWSAVVGATKEKDIAERCRRIESLKSTLQLWYQHQSNAGLRGVKHQLAIMKRLGSHEDPVPSLDGPLGRRRRRPRRNGAFCTCRPSGSSTYLRIYGLQLFCSQETAHSPNCPQRDSSTSWSCGVRALSPRIQMMVGIQLGGWTLSMVGRLSPHNMVDGKKSPAFIAIDKACLALESLEERCDALRPPGVCITDYQWPSYLDSISARSCVQEEAKATFDTLFQQLREAFQSGKASPGDRMANGRTLLHDFVSVAAQCVSLHGALYRVLDAIVKLLVAGNADPNACIPYTGSPVNPLCHASMAVKKKADVQDNKLDEILIKHGCDTSQALQYRATEPHLVGMLIKNHHLLEDHDQYPAHVAVIKRSEVELRLLLMQNKIDLHTKTPSLLSLAVGWTTGLQILLEAGANPDDAILTGIWQDHLPSIELLVNNGCSLFDLGRGSFTHGRELKADAIFFATLVPASSDVIRLLVQKVVERRLELLQLATKQLPETCLNSLGYNKQQQTQLLLDYNALEIFRQLEARKVQVPKSLWPGSTTTLYHHSWMTDTLAKRLYDVGFCSIDEQDGKGHSPLMNTVLRCYTWDCIRFAQWCLRKGSQLPRSMEYTDFLDQATEFTLSISSNVWITKDSKLFGPLSVFSQLHPNGVEQRDGCYCWCSTSGCTPVGIVLRKNSWGWLVPRYRQRWLFNIARYSYLGLSLSPDTFADICRLEVFDRLGMAHTCSHWACDCYRVYGHSYSGCYGGDDSSSELEELQEEDHHLKQALDSYLELYLCLYQIHADRFESFWIAWWIALEYFLPFETSNKYHRHLPLKLDSVCDPRRCDEDQSHDSYEPRVEAITAFLDECVPQLGSETRARFLRQFELTESEFRSFSEWSDYDGLFDDTDGDGDDSD